MTVHCQSSVQAILWTLSVTAEDSDGVAEVKLYYRQTGAQFWENVVMSETDNQYISTIETVTVPRNRFLFSCH